MEKQRPHLNPNTFLVEALVYKHFSYFTSAEEMKVERNAKSNVEMLELATTSSGRGTAS